MDIRRNGGRISAAEISIPGIIEIAAEKALNTNLSLYPRHGEQNVL